jgi:hypothetical protein
MANSNVFRGSDATLSLAPIAQQRGTLPVEIEEGSALIAEDQFNLSVVGRVTNVEIFVQTDLRAFYQIGNRKAQQLREGPIAISGKVERAHINGALLRLLLGRSGLDGDATDPTPTPTFNMSLLVANPADPATTSVMKLYSVKFDNWGYGVTDDDFIMESATFKALDISVTDQTG